MVMMMILVAVLFALALILFCLWRVPTGNWISERQDALLGVFGVILVISIIVGVILIIKFNDSAECFDDMGYPCIEEDIGAGGHPREHQ